MKRTPLKVKKVNSLKKCSLKSNTVNLKKTSTLKGNSSLKSTGTLNKTNSELVKTELKKRNEKSKEQWENARNRIIERDHGKCRICGKPGTQVHHIHLRSKRKDLLYHDNNLILLCDKHHFHSSTDRYEEQTALIAKALNMTVEELLDFAEH